MPSPLPGVRLVATWRTVRHLPPGVLSVRRRLASWPRSYFDVASENDVSDEIHVEATSTDGATRSTSRVLTARDTARAHKQVGGSSGSTRVRWVELVDLRRLVHGEVLTCRSKYLRVDQRRVRNKGLSQQNGGCVYKQRGALPSQPGWEAPCALSFQMPPSGRTTGARPSPATSARRPGTQTPQTLVPPVPPTGPIALGAGGTN